MANVINIVIPRAEHNHASWFGHTHQFGQFRIWFIAENVTSHRHISKTVQERQVSDQPINGIDVRHAMLASFFFELIPQVADRLDSEYGYGGLCGNEGQPSST